MKQQYDAKMKRNASRLDVLSEDLDNVHVAALKLGYPIEMMSPRLQTMMKMMRDGMVAARSNLQGILQMDGGPSPSRPPRRGSLAIGDGMAAEVQPPAGIDAAAIVVDESTKY